MMRFLFLMILGVSFSFPAFAREKIQVRGADVCGQTPPENIAPSLYLWGKEDESPWHESYKTYHTKPMNFCHGATPATKPIVYVTPSWNYHVKREDWYYPIRMIDTVAGVLTIRGSELRQPVTLNGQEFLSDMDDPAYFYQVYPEQEGKPQIIILNYTKKEDLNLIPESYPAIRILDLGVSPPYFSEKFIPFFPRLHLDTKTLSEELINKMKENECPFSERFKIEKIDEGKYLFSGLSRDGYEANGILSDGETFRQFLYDRKTRAVTEIKTDVSIQ